MKQIRSIVLLSIVIIIASELLYIGRHNLLRVNAQPTQETQKNSTTKQTASVYQYVIKNWGPVIDSAGAENAYTQFKQQLATVPTLEQHAIAHAFGELLYDKLTFSGVTVCDGSFTFGCYHGYFAKAVYVNDVAIVPQLEQACIEKWGNTEFGCQHGIGHGLFGYFGETRLLEALQVCTTLKISQPLRGCQNGVLMEYYFPTMENKGWKWRPRTSSNTHAPCDTLPPQFLPACYYEIPHWWYQVYEKDTAILGVLCNNIERESLRTVCISGIGSTLAVNTNFNAQKTKAQCALIHTKDYAARCIAGAAGVFAVHPLYKDNTKDLCKGILPLHTYPCKPKS